MTEEKYNMRSFQPEAAFLDLYSKAVASGLKHTDIAKLHALNEIQVPREKTLTSCLLSILKYLSLLIFLLCCIWFLDWPLPKDKLAKVWLRTAGVAEEDVDYEKCLLRSPEVIVDFLRPPVDCAFCENVTEVTRLEAVASEDFEKFYAYSGWPAVIVDATKNWSALETFSFEFFQELYSESSTALKSVESRCQFFPYKTEFRGLREVFLMNPDRAHLKDGAKPWYIGWSNCDVTAGNILRQHYQRPYFLPRYSESSKTDWIFMGSPGYGAHMHVDNVHLPSWQAQITGTKRWVLEPPSECFTSCPASLQVDVQPGEINIGQVEKQKRMEVLQLSLPVNETNGCGSQVCTRELEIPPPPTPYSASHRFFHQAEPKELTTSCHCDVVLDTNKWFHSTLNIGNDISITIGSEYD